MLLFWYLSEHHHLHLLVQFLVGAGLASFSWAIGTVARPAITTKTVGGWEMIDAVKQCADSLPFLSLNLLLDLKHHAWKPMHVHEHSVSSASHAAG